MPSGYIIANVRVTNPAQYEEYKKWPLRPFRPTTLKLRSRGAVEVMEGDWTQSGGDCQVPELRGRQGLLPLARIRQGPRRPRRRGHHALVCVEGL